MSDTTTEHNGLPVLDYVPVGRTIRSVSDGVMTVEAEGEKSTMFDHYERVVMVALTTGQAFTLRGDGPFVWRDVTPDYDADGDLVGFTGVADLVKP